MQVPHYDVKMTNVDLAAHALKRMNTIRTLLFICSPGTISVAMTAALESEFPWLAVKAFPDIRHALVEFDNPIQLVLADAALAPALNEHWAEFSAIHSEAALALLCGDDDESGLHKQRVENFQSVRGIVPFNVNLDVFLSALRIILRGGRYFSSSSYRREAGTHSSNGDARVEPGSPPELSEARARAIDKLTKRENEILMRVAMGNQNKTIAAALGLSEHTVKIHIHNIITKLGVHNRTEVVARYFEHKRKDDSGHAHDPIQRQDGNALSGNEQ